MAFEQYQAAEAPESEGIEPEQGENQVQEISASDLVAPEENAETKQTGAESTQKPKTTRNSGANTQPAQKIETQQDIDRRLGYRINEERSKVMRSPQYSLGAELLADYMARNGVTEEEAARRIRSERADQKAKDAKADPEKFYRDYYAKQETPDQPKTSQRQSENATTGQGGDLASELQHAVASGNLPQGFQPEHIDQFFVNDAQAYGLQYAFDRWEQSHGGQQQRSATQQQRQTNAKPMRVTGTEATRKPLSFTTEDMSSDEFNAFREKARKASDRGERVVFR